jgi:hypothetical protein
MADEKIPPTEAAHHDVHHEYSDVNVGAILWSAVILVIFAIVVHVAIYGHVLLLRKSERNPELLPISLVKRDGPAIPPAPRLQPFPTPGPSGKGASPMRNVPPRDMAEMRRDQQKHLSSYGWANQATRTVHVPIDRAIDLQLQKGFPVASGQQPSFTGDGPAQPVPTPDMTQPAPSNVTQPVRPQPPAPEQHTP